MISVHNVPYALQRIRDVFPHHESGENGKSVICSIFPSSFFICLSHLLYDPDLFHEQAGALSGKPSPFPGQTQILARRAPGDNIHRREFSALQTGDIPDMEHIREPLSGHLNREVLDFTCPNWLDAVLNRCQRESSDPIEQASKPQPIAAV